ncbi:MAG: hypothetical protein EOM23_02080 [Candidatus Moranbacteria bacterium]|nr:hypothetical protein [Candidatus Moranbacteria bacterium]
MKKIVLMLSLITLLANGLVAQDDKTVTLTASGQGKTPEEARQNALRSAIEQAFGTFISSNTEILNDELVKDEIVSISNGNIQKFDILSEVQMQNGDWSSTLNAVVSVSKLTSFCESKGISVEFKGSLFAYNINLQILNEKNEIKAIKDMCQTIRNIADVSFDYTITVSDPISVDANNSQWSIPLCVSVYKNSNFDNIPKILYATLNGISLSLEEAKNYIKLGKKIYPISIALSENEYSYIFLRNEASIFRLLETLYYFNHSLQNFTISNGIAEWSIIDYPNNLIYIYDYGFRIFLKRLREWGGTDGFCKNSVFYTFCSPSGRRNMGHVKEPERVYADNRFDSWVVKLDYKSLYSKLTNTNTNLYEGIWTYMLRYQEETYLYGLERKYFIEQFSFVKNLKPMLLNNQLGLVISFIPNTKEGEEIVRFYYNDLRDINEINKITEYKALPKGI